MTETLAPTSLKQAKSRPQVICRSSKASEIDSAAAVYAEAFMSDPEIQFIFQDLPPDSNTYKQAVAAMYTKATRVMFCRSGCPSWCAVDVQSQSVVGAAHVLPFKHYTSLLTFAAYGLLWGLQWPSLNCLFRALQTSEAAAVAAKHARLAITGELCSIGVLPEYQRQGIGWQLLTATLQQWDEEYGGGLILYTTNESNYKFYAKAGFVVLETREPQDDDTGSIKVWYMYRPAGWLTSTRFAGVYEEPH